ncbi:CHAT domain-containing protein [Nostoc sp. ChiVER01]|uniref:CHAT domain-containing protein n=1 Tax=Nostoc sp. ChiVER01 TaxID=3075382 RepID=UPI002AD4B90A|nr:CHAT domain-containing protein [Nostoc sp. ChiVER01]MDZ8225097.1 CHAT domain-containing protein [Nostoc sp. ChiVER01]
MNKINFLAIIFLITKIISPISVKAETLTLSQLINNKLIAEVGERVSKKALLRKCQKEFCKRYNLSLENSTTEVPLPRDAVAEQEKIWKKGYENYLGAIFSNQLMTSNTIKNKLQEIENDTGKKSAVIYLIPTNKQLEILLVTAKNNPINKSISVANKNTLFKVTKQFQAELSNPREVNTTSYLASAQQLYQWLIAPIEKDLKAQNIDTLVFCVGTGLRSVPLSALHDGQKFLIENYNISLIPAFSLIDTRYTDIRKSSVLAMGASQFKDFDPLPAVPIELSTIVENQGGERFLNDKFTLNNLRSQRKRQPYKIVHLATHGVFQPGTASNSYIQFWNNKLYLNQLRQLQLNVPTVDLLVLSACRTALGDRQAELGFSGLALQAGVKSAMGSLWSVNDAGTLALMTEFYMHLKTAPIKAEALRQAQIRMLKGQVQFKQGQLRSSGLRTEMPLPPELSELGDLNLSHPYYWAAFTMIGSPW